MKAALDFLALLLLASPSISYFKYQRQLQVPGAGRQHYLVVDDAIWSHARPDLGDLRLYAGDSEIPYALAIERGSSELNDANVRVLQPATVNGKTRFVLDMSEVPEYNRVRLKLSARNFVAHARIEGQEDLHGRQWASLGTTTLYDLSDENLGGNSTLQLPLTSYKYLRVTLDDAVQPSQVKGAASGVRQDEKAIWREIGGHRKWEQQGRDTVLTFIAAANQPVERLHLNIDPDQPNFRRDLEIRDDKRRWLASGALCRIHMSRHGQRIDVEQTSIEFHLASPHLRVVIHNGDDPPLKISSVNFLQYERRVYFEPASGIQAKLYYGDEKLEPPVYDYSKLFQKDPAASKAEAAPEEINAAYVARPDTRPWSERHPVVLWAAIVAAVLVLGGLAMRSLRAAASDR